MPQAKTNDFHPLFKKFSNFLNNLIYYTTDVSHFANFEQVKKINSHFDEFEQVNKSKVSLTKLPQEKLVA